MTRALVFIIIPSYNHGRYLRSAISSVLAQSYDDFEIIVVDDGSTDDSVPMCQQYGSAVPCVSQANRGLAAARNRGLEMARGDWLQFLDVDDLIAKDKLAPLSLAPLLGRATLSLSPDACRSVWSRTRHLVTHYGTRARRRVLRALPERTRRAS